MPRPPGRLVSLCALAAALLVPATSGIARAAVPAAGGGQIMAAPAGSQLVLRARPADDQGFVPPMKPVPEVGAESATFIVTYDTDFNNNPQAKAAFQYAVDLWSQLVTTSVPIRINAQYDPLGSTVLGSSGPDSVARDACLAMTSNTWYPIALANAICGTDLDPGGGDATSRISSNFTDWYFGTDGATPMGKWDMVSVVLHELGHALGFIGSGSVSGSSGSWGRGDGRPEIYDTFVEDNAGTPITSSTSPSAALKTTLTSNALFFDGTNADAAHGGNRVPLYAPNPWESGSSYSHLDENSFPDASDDPNALMTPIVSSGHAFHSPGSIVIGMFKDMGWPQPIPPNAPTITGVTSGSNAARVTFSAPISNGGSAVTSYTVTATPTVGTPVTATSTDTTSAIWIAGLTNGTAYTFTLTATNPFGDSPPSAPFGPVTPTLHGFHPVDPARILDTRSGIGKIGAGNNPPSGPLAAQQTISVKVAGEGGVPLGADAVVLNVTAVHPTAYGWLTVFPSGTSTPTASNLNFVANATTPNLVTVKIGPDGKVNVTNTGGYSAAGFTHVIFDVAGWYAADGSGEQVNSVTPKRIVDTRSGVSGGDPKNTPLVAGAAHPVQVTGAFGIVPNNATAVVLNVTVTRPTAPGFLTVYPWDLSSPPSPSNLNFVTNDTVANLVEVKLGSNGAIKIFNGSNSGSVDVIVDIVGWYGPTATRGGLNADTPVRVADTRSGVPGANTRGFALAPQERAIFRVTGVGKVPAAGVSAVVINVTAVKPSARGWLTVYPGDVSQTPTASNLNFVASVTRANLVVVGVAPDGTIKIANTFGCSCAGSVNVIIDIVGWFADT